MKNWSILFLWCLAIFFLSSQSAVEVSDSFSLDYAIHKLAHIIVYAGLQYFSLRAFTLSSSVKKPVLWATLFSLIFAITDEVHQAFVPTRSARVLDVGFDMIGIMLTNLLIFKLKWLPLNIKISRCRSART